MGVYTHTDSGNWLSRRGTFLILLVAFHVLLLWALKSGFAIKFIESITEPIKVDIINEVKPEEPPPPPPPQKAVELPPISVPPVLVDIQIPVEPPPITITTEPPPPGPPAPVVYGPPAPPAPPAPVAVTGYALLSRPDTADYYPPASVQLQEEGRPKIKICFGTNGRVTDATLVETSGKKRLDDAAVKMGKQYRFKPGTTDGVAQAQCVNQAIVFTLKDAR